MVRESAGAMKAVTVRFPIKGPLGISFTATDAASPPLISAISATGLAGTVANLEVGLMLVKVQGCSVEHGGFDAAIAAIKAAARPLELVFAPAGGSPRGSGGGGGAAEANDSDAMGHDSDDASFESTGAAGLTVLMQAAVEGLDATLAALRGSSNLDAQDDNGWTALHHACDMGDAAVVEELLRAGCAVDVEDGCGETAADIAESGGHSALVELLHKCAEASMTQEPGQPEQPDRSQLERELRHARSEVAELQADLQAEKRCISTLQDQAHVGRDEALASLLDELELARTQLQVARRDHRELEDRVEGGSSKDEQDKMRLRLRQVEQVLSDMEQGMASATRREEEVAQRLVAAEAERSAAVSDAAAAREESEMLDAKVRDQSTKITSLRRKQSAQKEHVKQEERQAADEALAEGAAGWEAQLREQAETVDTQGRKLRELSRQLAEHRVSKENATREASNSKAATEKLLKTVAVLTVEAKEHAAVARKADQLQRMLNNERERAQAAAIARNGQHEQEVNAMKDEVHFTTANFD